MATRSKPLRRHTAEPQRVTFIELFFDLVFVLVVTRLSALLLADHTVGGAARTGFLLLVAWWAWIYTTWTTNWFEPDAPPVRAVLLVGMLSSLFGAIAIPQAFGARALLLVGGYVAVQLFRNAFAVLSTRRDDPLHLPLARILAWSMWVGAIWLAGALVDAGTRTWLWLAALVLDYAGPYLGHWTPGLGRTRPSEWDLEPSHFVERIELFMIIALGESIMAIGVIAGALDLTAARVLGVVVAFGITVGLWWLYFDFHAERALEMLRAAASERGRLGRELTYIHIPMVAGVIVTAVASELVVAHPDRPLPVDQRWLLAAGPALYLLGSVGFKRRILQAPWQNRTIAAAAAVAAPFLGSALPSLAVWSLVLAILAALAATEAGERRRVAVEAAVLEDEAVEVVEG